MRALLWPDATIAQHLEEIDRALSGAINGSFPLATLVAVDDTGSLTGFLEVGMRSHADGCDPSRPVGFVEGWFVHEASRNRGVGKQLMRAAEEWAREKGCVEMASDALIDNHDSQYAHEALGYEIVIGACTSGSGCSPGENLSDRWFAP